MAKPKYSLETRLAADNHNISGKDGTKCTAYFFALKVHLLDVRSEPGNYTVLMEPPGKKTVILLNFGKLLSWRGDVL